MKLLSVLYFFTSIGYCISQSLENYEFKLIHKLEEVHFEKDYNKEYIEIVNDTNNFVELDILINSKKYQLKRFINKNDIFDRENNRMGLARMKDWRQEDVL